jgi:hypothetical protein
MRSAVVDYTTASLERLVQDVDLVLDGVGGEIQVHALAALRRGGTLISLASPPPQQEARMCGVRAVLFIISVFPFLFRRVQNPGEKCRVCSGVLEADQLCSMSRRGCESTGGRRNIVPAALPHSAFPLPLHLCERKEAGFSDSLSRHPSLSGYEQAGECASSKEGTACLHLF